jgi:hypothetical protein
MVPCREKRKRVVGTRRRNPKYDVKTLSNEGGFESQISKCDDSCIFGDLEIQTST